MMVINLLLSGDLIQVDIEKAWMSSEYGSELAGGGGASKCIDGDTGGEQSHGLGNMIETRICASLGLRMKFKTRFSAEAKSLILWFVLCSFMSYL